jgi:HEAT repeat protein
MSSSKPFCIVTCLLLAALPARAGKPNDNRSNDSSQQRLDTGYTKEWGGKSFEEWKKDFKYNPDPSARVYALMALLNFKQRPDALPDVIAKLREDQDASVRVKAAQLMRWIPHHETDRTRIIKGLAHAISHDPQSIVRYEAAHSLQYFCPLNFNGKEEKEALQDLVMGINSTSTFEVRDICIVTLMLAGRDMKNGPDPRVTDALITRANPAYEGATQVRLHAIMALGAQGRPPDPRKLQRVLDVLKMPVNYRSSHPTIRIWSHVAIIALVEKVDKKDLDTIAGYLTDREAATREQAATALGALEEKAQDYVKDILKMLNRENVPAVKAAAAEALGRMKNVGPNVIHALISLTEDDERESMWVVRNACIALVRLGFPSPEVLKAMDKAAEHKSLEKWQKDEIRKMIEELQNPKKRPAKDAPKEPEKPVAPKQNKGR